MSTHSKATDDSEPHKAPQSVELTAGEWVEVTNAMHTAASRHKREDRPHTAEHLHRLREKIKAQSGEK